MSDPVKAYLAKYALTDGIEVVEVWDNEDGYAVQRGRYVNLWKWDRDIFRTRGAAVSDAIKRRERRVTSLKNQIAKLEAMSFL